MRKNFISYFLFFKLISFSLNLQCNDEKIDNCIKHIEYEDKYNCQKGKIKKCAQCEDKYFSFLNGFLCIPCDDPMYGQVGCERKCDGYNYNYARNIKCEVCKEGY